MKQILRKHEINVLQYMKTALDETTWHETNALKYMKIVIVKDMKEEKQDI